MAAAAPKRKKAKTTRASASQGKVPAMHSGIVETHPILELCLLGPCGGMRRDRFTDVPLNLTASFYKLPTASMHPASRGNHVLALALGVGDPCEIEVITIVIVNCYQL